MGWKEFASWISSVFPNANPGVVATYSILAFIFVWFFKEFKNQYTRELEKKHERVDKTIEMYAELLAALTHVNQDDTNQDVRKMLFKPFPYIDKEMYYSLKEYLRVGNLELRQDLVDQVYERLDRLKSKYNYINYHDFTFTGVVESFGMFLRRYFVPFFFIFLLFIWGILVLLLYSFNPDPFYFIARLSSLFLVFIILLFLGDVCLKKGFIQNMKRNGISYLFIVIGPIIILFSTQKFTVIIGIILFIIGIFFKEIYVYIQKYLHVS